MSSILQAIDALCPFPHSTASGDLESGWRLELDRTCLKCTHHACVKWFRESTPTEGISHYVCEHELVSYSVGILSQKVLIVGVFDRTLTLVQDKARRARLAKTRLLTREMLEEWAKRCTSALERYERVVRQDVEEAIAPLHDLKAAVGMLQRNVERVVQRYPGDSLEEKIDRAEDQDIVRLLKTASVLTTRLELTAIVNNPSAAAYGRRRPGCQVYRICHKFVRLFEPMARDKGLRIEMAGVSYGETRVFDSFETIPLLLIENAIKYSEKDKTVTVRVNDLPEAISIRVESYGRTVAVDERQGIFQRGFRGRNTSKSGTGLGLYIASIVADAHDASITYTSEGEVDGFGWNLFIVTLPREKRPTRFPSA